MTLTNDISEIRAEVLLNYLYPELEDRWRAHYDGAFYRNYNRDALYVNTDTAEVSLARDGFLRLLPQGLLSNTDELRKGNNQGSTEELEWRIHMLSEAFVPFDSYVFHNKLNIERQVSELLDDKLAYVLREYFGYDIKQETSPLVRDAAVLLPYVSWWRGDFGFIKNLLRSLIHCDVVMTEGRYSHLDTTVCWLPKVRYELLISGLTPEEYRQRNEEIQPLRDFLIEWFIPFDVVCEILIKEHPTVQNPAGSLTLDYNTETLR